MGATADHPWIRPGRLTIVIVHFAVTLWHGIAHFNIPVPLTAMQTAFVGIVIVLMPAVGAGLLWTPRKQTAAWVITVSMFASLMFGLINHFVLYSPDYVMEVPEHAWRHAFVLSAALVAIAETAGTVVGAVAAFTLRRESMDERRHFT